MCEALGLRFGALGDQFGIDFVFILVVLGNVLATLGPPGVAQGAGVEKGADKLS